MMTVSKRLSDTQLSISCTLLFLLLFYEATLKVISAPTQLPFGESNVNEPLSEKSTKLESRLNRNEDLQKFFQPKPAIIMPVWARKAGGNWKPELLKQQEQQQPNLDISATLDDFSSTMSVVGEQSNDPDQIENRDKDHQMELKADEVDQRSTSFEEITNDSSSKSKYQDEQKKSITRGDTDGDIGKREEEDNVWDEYEDWDSEEPECPEDMYFHIRGKRCVPVTCPGGNAWRDQSNGECILKRYGYRKNRWRGSKPWRPYRRIFYGKGRGSRTLLFG